MPSGVYERDLKKCKTIFEKGRTPHNKGKETEKKLKKLEKFKLGLPIECKIHGEHTNWRMHSSNNVQCRKCAARWQMEMKKRDPLRFLYRDARRHAKKQSREFKITIEDLKNLMIIQENKCALSGIKFDENNLPSLDRIDSKIGYVKENIQLVLIKINRMKSDFESNEFLEICKDIYRYSIRKSINT
jgi:hypothetical protein